ncbi:MAG: hypothetical protein RL199_1911, partial [Pseudomonadota bacterium]
MSFLVRLLAPVALALAACHGGGSGSDSPTVPRTYSFKALSGVSMGAIGAAFLAGSGDHGKDIDAIGSLGGPMDAAWFLAGLERMQLGGFCPYDRLIALAESNPKGLNDPASLDCMKPAPSPTPGSYELPQDFNHWRFTTNGGTFDRSKYMELFWDLSLAMGNPLYFNPDSAVFPVPQLTKANFNAALCDAPVVVKRFFNKEYNPEGKYDVITFCDGEEPIYYCEGDAPGTTSVDFCKPTTPAQQCGGADKLKTAGKGSNDNPKLYFAKKGVYDPCFNHVRPLSIALSVDFNGNGRRDYHEPIVINSRERFQDTGRDGCPSDREDGRGGCGATGAKGDPNGDDFDPVANPLGSENDFRREEGESYEDAGLDGVGGTGDFGEGNGVYDDGPVRKHWLETDFRQKYLASGSTLPSTIDVYADGGIRDLFNLGFSGDVLLSGTRALRPGSSRRYTDFAAIPQAGGGAWEGGIYDALLADYDLMGRNVFIRYGKENVSETERWAGFGDHVGSTSEIFSRFSTYAKWMSHHWERVLGPPTRIQAPSRAKEEVFFSESLGALWNFGIALPPGYDDPANANKRYPVVSLGHGYGMDAGGMSNLKLIIDQFMSHGDVLPMIFVYPSGNCCHLKPDGSADCRDRDEAGVLLDDKPGYTTECSTGTFY